MAASLKASTTTVSTEFIGWVEDDGGGSRASAASVKSAQSAASASSRRSSASARSARSQRSHRSAASSSSRTGGGGTGGGTGGGNGKSLQERLEKIAENSASSPPANGGGTSANGTVGSRSRSQPPESQQQRQRSFRSAASRSSHRSASSRRSAASGAASVRSARSARSTTSASSSGRAASKRAGEVVAEEATASSTNASSSVSSSGFTSVTSLSSLRASASSRASSAATSSTRPTSNKGSGVASVSSVSSYRSSTSSRTGKLSARGQQAEGLDALEGGDYALAASLFTQSLEENLRRGGRDEAKEQQTLATLYGHRCEALYELGAYDAAAGDARKALLSEALSRAAGTPYAPPPGRRGPGGATAGRSSLHPERGPVLRSRAQCLLGNALLRQGDTEGVLEAFEASIDVAERALEEAGDAPEVTRVMSVTHRRALAALRASMGDAAAGKSALAGYVALRERLENGSPGKNYVEMLDELLEVAPASIGWHVAKVRFLVGRRRWFAVANHCERVAARAAERDGVFAGDLATADPFPGIPPLRDLDPHFFADDGDGDSGGVPSHLRKLGAKASRDAAFRMPRELLPYYLRALRLEERYKEAVAVGTALAEHDATPRFAKEWDKVDKTIKLKEEGDSLFRDGYFDRAAALYGECLDVDRGAEGSSGAPLPRKGTGWQAARPSATDAGGKLHAVLHSNRAACFSSMGRYDDAIKESSHAIELHSMYTRAILRRARCHAKMEQIGKAKEDFNRYVILVEGARDNPYPPPNLGSSCFFDMPADVSDQQLGAVKKEMSELGIRPIGTRAKRGKTRGFKLNSRARNRDRKARVATTEQTKTSWKDALCCKKKAESQVLIQPSENLRPNATRTGGNPKHTAEVKRKVSFSANKQATGPSAVPPPQSAFPSNPPPKKGGPALIKSRPAFDHPLDAPSIVDINIDYYAVLGLAPLASDADIKQAYYKLAREYHPDRNDSEEAQARFQDVKLAYTILTDSEKKMKYDKAAHK